MDPNPNPRPVGTGTLVAFAALGAAMMASVFGGVVVFLVPGEEPPAPGARRIACVVAEEAPTTSGLVGPPVVFGHLSVRGVRFSGRTYFGAVLYSEPIGDPVVRVELTDGGTMDLDLSRVPLDAWTRRGFVYHHEEWQSLEGTALSAKVPGWEDVRRDHFHVAVGGIRSGQPLIVDIDATGVRRIVPGP